LLRVLALAGEPCVVCGGDGQIGNAFGRSTKCPTCHGSGRRQEAVGFHDVTKTKPSHHKQANKNVPVEKQTWPSTHEGGQLATDIRDSGTLSADSKAKLIREIIDHEATHGQCTQTFIKKVRKQVRPPA
jgi:RecJ-like exonuclease